MPLRPFRKPAPQARQLAAGRAVRELFEQHGRMVHAVCRLNLRDRLDAEDATQQTFLSAYRSLLGGGEPSDPPAWLAAIARNECSRVRRRRIDTVPIDDSDGAEGLDVTSAVEQREEIDALAAALSELAPSQRDAVVLREFYGLSYAEVAAVLGVSGPAVESLLFKGRRHLQEKLGSMRVASALVLPDTLRDALTQALPGFGGGAAAAGGKVVAFPAAAKVAALAVVVTGGGVTVAGTVQGDAPRPGGRPVTRTADSSAGPAVPSPESRPRGTRTLVSRTPTASGPRAVPRVRTRAAEREDEHELDERENERAEEEELDEREENDEVAEREDTREDEDEDHDDQEVDHLDDAKGSDASDGLDD